MTVRADHPTWTRSCGDCKRYVFGANGELSTSEVRRPDGTAAEVPMPLPPGMAPPCGVCPKLAGVAVKAPLHPADDFGGAFADLWQWYREGRAVGFARGLDPLMRAVAALFHAWDERDAADGLVSVVRAAVADLLVSANILRRA